MAENGTTTAVTKTVERKSLVATIAAQYDMEPQPFLDAVTQTCMPNTVQVSNAMIAAFLLVCHEHGLNPFTREIFAFPTKTGGIQPIVSVDGWIKLVTQHPQYNGMEFDMKLDEKTGKPVSCTCTIFRKDRERHMPITEYFDECYRDTEPWKKMPKRMMRHKALKEAARYTFGFAGIQDEDEGLDAINITNQSSVIARETMTKTEQLKEKIGAKKAAPKVEPAPEPNTPPPTEGKTPTGNPLVEEEKPYGERLESLRNHVDQMLFNPEPEPEPEPEPDRLLTDEERNSLLAVLRTKAKNREQEAIIAKAARQKFMEYGAASTKQLTLKSFPEIIAWATGYEIPGN